MSQASHSLGMIGYGEVGRIFCAGLKSQVAGVSAWDLKFAADPDGEARRHAQQAGVRAAGSMQALCRRQPLYLCRDGIQHPDGCRSSRAASACEQLFSGPQLRQPRSPGYSPRHAIGTCLRRQAQL